jgi:hypothetical protein
MNKPFEVSVSSVEEAEKMVKVLTSFSAYEYEHNIKHDYSEVF